LEVDLLDCEGQQRLLRLARCALEARVRGAKAPAPERGGLLDEPRGAFVTVHRDGELRGCLGRLEIDWPLAETVAHLAAIVADADPRFDPVAVHELPSIELEISVLTPEREIERLDEIEIGRHGVIVERGSRRGLLLPQVATEHAWDRETFVAHTCLKAGLPPDAWRGDVRILIFEAQVFGEKDVFSSKSSEASR
jgi:AmmeMemoRadiSam system protein A